jgi:hypothetical protein
MPKPADAAAHITYMQQYRKCGSIHCARCKSAEFAGHGPYWYGYYSERMNGKRRLRTWYIGKQLPPGAITPHAARSQRRAPHP